MYRHCVFCNGDLGANREIEQFPIGRRLAFDAETGRLWVVCAACLRWNLTPLEERWEAIEECERRFSATRQRASTEHIGLARLAEGLELVRIGRPQRPEFAAWRYGNQLARRHRRSMIYGGSLIAGFGALWLAGPVAGVAVGMGPFHAFQGGHALWQMTTARRVRMHAQLGAERVPLRYIDFRSAQIVADPEAEDGWLLRLKRSGRELELAGSEACRTIQVLVRSVNQDGGSAGKVRHAVNLIEGVGGSHRLLLRAHHATVDRYPFSRSSRGVIRELPKPVRLAVEMAVNEEAERRALEGELTLLERAWREADELARIADELTLPERVMQQFRRLRGDASPVS